MNSTRAWLVAIVMGGCAGGDVMVPRTNSAQLDSGVSDLGTGVQADASDGGGGASSDLASDGTHGPLPTPGGAEKGAYADFIAKAAAAACQRAVRCGSVAAADEHDCETAELADITTPPPYTVDDALAAQRAHLDASAAQACVTTLQQSGCGVSDYNAITSACANVVTGTVANGAGCRAQFECAAGFCAARAPGCAGLCKAYVSAGFSCANAVCDDNSYCDSSSSVCVARGIANSPCSDAQPCRDGFVCRGYASGSSTPGKCGTVAKSGDACVSSAECDSGLWCDPGTSKCAVELAAGASCTASDACQSGLACIGLKLPGGTSVGNPGQCKPWLDVNAMCDATAAEPGCPADAQCASNSCKPTGVVGAACTSSTQCRLGLYCNGSGMCATPVPYGGVCDPMEMSFSQCSAGTCDTTARACLTYCS
jgi:hypothetical protein